MIAFANSKGVYFGSEMYLGTPLSNPLPIWNTMNQVSS